MAEHRNLVFIGVKAEQPVVGAYPVFVLVLDDIGDKGCGQAVERRRNVAAHDASFADGEPLQRSTDGHPHAAISLHVGNEHVRRIGHVGIFQQLFHRTVVMETDAVDVAHRHYPHLACRVAADVHGLLLQDAVQPLLLVVGNDGLQRLQVQHLGELIEGYPQPLVMVFAQVAARVALQLPAVVAHAKVKRGVAVVAHQSAAMRGYPDEAIAVGHDVIDKVCGQSVGHVQAQHVVALGQWVLRPAAECPRQCCQQQRHATKAISHQFPFPKITFTNAVTSAIVVVPSPFTSAASWSYTYGA